jgi:dolichol kinase
MPPKKVNKKNSSTVTHRVVKHKDSVLDYEIDTQYELSKENNEGSGLNDETPSPPDVKNGVFSYYIGLIDMYINTRHVFQTFLMIFLINLLYLAFKQEEEKGVKNLMDNFITASCVLLATLLECMAVLNSRFRQFESGKTTIEPSLIDFNYIFTVIFPLIICLLKAPEKVLIISCIVVQVSYMNIFVRVLISYVILVQFGNENNSLTGQLLALPISSCFFYEMINKFVENNLPIYEKTFLSILITSLSYFITYSQSNLTLFILKNLFLSFTVGLILSSPILELYKSQKEKTLKYFWLLSIYIIFISSSLIISDKLLLNSLGKFHLNWLIDFINESSIRISIFKNWIIFTIILIPSIFILFNKFNIGLCLKRKIWHFIIFGFLIQPIIIEPELTSIALFGITGILILIEIIRSNELPPFGKKIKLLFSKYEDEKDNEGKFILSYIYLIIGISLPFWVNNINNKLESSYIGLITLGLGDSIASIIGNKFGVFKWPNSNKTIEGSFAMVISIIIGYFILDYFNNTYSLNNNDPLIGLNWNNRVMCAILCAVFEGIVDMNDNLFVPVFGYIIEELLMYFN